MPALFITISNLPYVSNAFLIISCALSHEETLSLLIIAFPPFWVINPTVSCAGDSEPPSPVNETPISLTTIETPSLARARAISRPIPPPAPVTTATLSFNPKSKCINNPLILIVYL